MLHTSMQAGDGNLNSVSQGQSDELSQDKSSWGAGSHAARKEAHQLWRVLQAVWMSLHR